MAKQGQSARASGDEAAGVAPSSALPLAELFRQKRREAGLSQQELAERCGVKQSAISGFERHGSAAQALSVEKLRQVADLLGIVVDEAQVKARPHAARLALFYCPDPDCPSTHVYPLGAQTAYRPRFVRAEAEVPFHCPDCGEICEKRCPECGTPISERLRGAFCSDCGKPLVAGDRLTAAAIAEREVCRAALTAAIPAVEFRHGREGGGAGGD
jgi:transcriptional regulator with XRE-family HTH domain